MLFDSMLRTLFMSGTWAACPNQWSLRCKSLAFLRFTTFLITGLHEVFQAMSGCDGGIETIFSGRLLSGRAREATGSGQLQQTQQKSSISNGYTFAVKR